MTQNSSEINPKTNGATSQKKQKPAKLTLQTPKGTKDVDPAEMMIKEKIFDNFKRIFQLHGGKPIDTPTFELREILTNKYGEEASLIYNLAEDDTKQKLSLRYDLTVPFARYLCQNRIRAIKKYQIGKVYRRDNPSFNTGRFREFYQCDFDIAGFSKEMVSDAEVLKIATSCLESVEVDDFTVKVNHRKLLFEIVGAAGVPEEKILGVCTTIDKADKLPRDEILSELVGEREINDSVASKVMQLMDLDFDIKSIDMAKEKISTIIDVSEKTESLLKEMKTLLKYCEAYGIEKKIQFSLSLARGLGYYTGMIFEVKLNNQPADGNIGSVAGGGRYDNLTKDLLSSLDTPCVGFSLGIERIYAYLKMKNGPPSCNNIKVLVCLSKMDMSQEEAYKKLIKLSNQILAKNIPCEVSSKTKILDNYNRCESEKIPLAVVLGQEEFNNGEVVLREIGQRVDNRVKLSNLVDEIKLKLDQFAVNDGIQNI